MEKIYSLLAATLLLFNAEAQVVYPVYNPQDSTFTFSYPQSIEIAKIKKEKKSLEKEIGILQGFDYQNERIIKKMIYKDSLSQVEIEACDRMNQGLIIKIDNSVSIINTYRKNVEDLELRLEKEEKRRKREAFWKNVYKISIPIVGILTLIISK